MSIIFLFLDGVGLAPAGPDNPLAQADTPALHALLGGPLTAERAHGSGVLLLKGIDATLGVAGLPQSGTGQTALLAGVNAAVLHGRHQPHVPPVALRPLLAQRSIFRRVTAGGGHATFANAFGPGYWEALAARHIRRSASVIAAQGAELRFRDMDDLRDGRALSWDITGAELRAREPAATIVTSHQAGANLAGLAHDHDLVFYECFLPDLAGHARLPTDIGAVMTLIDGLIGGILNAMRSADTLLITSDHGNVESIAAPSHTRNPVPLLVVGPAAGAFARVESIVDVADAIVGAALEAAV
jgi:2,3-bisphosphoglycerate-independent phosphoglycerate mutase